MRPWLSCLLLCIFVPEAFAVPGPDSTTVIANLNEAESVALARLYAETRDVPESQVCLLDLPSAAVIDLDVFQTQLVDPLTACLGPAAGRIEAALLIRGVPLNVRVPGENPGPMVAISVAAALQSHRSTFDADGLPLLGNQPPCTGSPCAAAVRNPFRSAAFEAGYESTVQGIVHRPWLVTMLHGYSYFDAAQLIASATTAEALGGASADIVLMEGANAPRAVLDPSFGRVMTALSDLGFASERLPFDANMSGRTLAAFVTGSQNLGDTIEGNDFHPGSIIDNLTSFGAVAANFDSAQNESQVSMARWVARGVAGVHGTTGEPLNNVFPSRFFIPEYFQGSTLAEAYHRNMPFIFWRNLVVGDPMAAPYAERPVVRFDGIRDGAVVQGAVELRAVGNHSRGVESVAVFVNGQEILRALGDEVGDCIQLPEGPQVSVLAVAQAAAGGTPQGQHRPKGWLRFTVEVQPGSPDCTEADAGTPDAIASDIADVIGLDIVSVDAPDVAVDAGTLPMDVGSQNDATPADGGDAPDDEGCACTTKSRDVADGAVGLPGLLVLILALGRRKARFRV